MHYTGWSEIEKLKLRHLPGESVITGAFDAPALIMSTVIKRDEYRLYNESKAILERV